MYWRIFRSYKVKPSKRRSQQVLLNINFVAELFTWSDATLWCGPRTELNHQRTGPTLGLSRRESILQFMQRCVLPPPWELFSALPSSESISNTDIKSKFIHKLYFFYNSIELNFLWLSL